MRRKKPHVLFTNDAPHSIELIVVDISKQPRWSSVFGLVNDTVKALKLRQNMEKLFEYQRLDGVAKPKSMYFLIACKIVILENTFTSY